MPEDIKEEINNQINENVAAELALDTAELDKTKEKAKKIKQRKKTSNAFAESLNTPQGKSITTGVFTALAVALLFFAAIAPALSSITGQLEINNKLQQKITNMRAKQSNLAALTKKEVDYATQLDQFNLLMSEDKHQSAIYAELLDFTNKSGLQFRSVNFSDEAQVKKYESLNMSDRMKFQQIRLITAGRLENAENLVTQLETSKRIYDVIDVNVSVPNVNQPSVLQIEVTLNSVYWVIPE